MTSAKTSTATRRLLAAAAATLLAITLAACSGNADLSAQYRSGSNKGYIAGDGSILEIPVPDRGAPVTFNGTSDTGAEISSEDYAGSVLVVNFWYAACAPCRAEAPDLVSTYQDHRADGVSFLGVNIRDQAATAREFANAYGLSYPSIADTDGSVKLSFAGELAPNAVPTTLVLDHEGRVAARVLGRVDGSTLSALIDRVVEEA
ncbi:Thiol-disulfide isomerase or thioredoxin [Paramicrobacterium humi]|uniref:Thiol-disulfide isomerase or thioredoxin n=1 Tax=Paramicrobacterium humi TaxID=640635 RepID=A0A1H4K456_9MICO|nr:Thiol-disulfide isomerase or thioredoxin [Microbacterium humi]